MKVATIIVILLLQTVLAGCASVVPVIDFYDADSDTLRRYKAIKVLDNTSPDIKDMKKLGEIDGIYCKRHPSQVPVDDDLAKVQAIDQVKLRAALAGANYITEPQCTVNRSADFSNNCMGVLMCTSSAFSFSN